MINNEQELFISSMFQDMYYPLAHYAKCILHDSDLAEDAVQTVFKIATSKIHDFMSSPNPKGWLVITLKNVLRNELRAQSRYNSIMVASITYDEAFITYDTNSNDETYIDTMYSDLLAKEDYELLKMLILKNYTIREAAEYMNISVEACKKRAQRAKEKLKKIIHELQNL